MTTPTNAPPPEAVGEIVERVKAYLSVYRVEDRSLIDDFHPNGPTIADLRTLVSALAGAQEDWIAAERKRRAIEAELGGVKIVRPFGGDEGESVRLLSRIHMRLKELGWRDAMYAPKDCSPLECVEVGCSAVLTNCHRNEVGFWHNDGNDTWPLSPSLFRAARGNDGRV